MPRVVDADERRSDVADAALRVILRSGLQGATMRSIAAEANCTTGLVTHYFANKDALLMAMVRQVAQRAGARLAVSGRGFRGLEALRSVLFESMPFAARQNDEWRIWISLWDRAITNEGLRNDWERRSIGWEGLLRRAIGEAVEDGELVQDAPVDDIVETLAAINYGLGAMAVLTPNRVQSLDAELLMDRQLAQIIAMYGPASYASTDPRPN